MMWHPSIFGFLQLCGIKGLNMNVSPDLNGIFMLYIGKRRNRLQYRHLQLLELTPLEACNTYLDQDDNVNDNSYQ